MQRAIYICWGQYEQTDIRYSGQQIEARDFIYFAAAREESGDAVGEFQGLYCCRGFQELSSVKNGGRALAAPVIPPHLFFQS